MATPVLPVGLLLGGAYLSWFAVHYWRTDVAWPSAPVKAVLTGRPIPIGHKSDAGQLTTSILTPGLSIYNNVTGARATSGASSSDTTPAAGATLSKAQLQQLWTANGGDPQASNVAAAVALAESSGRPAVTSPNPDGGTNVGLWQLDTRGVGAGYSIAQLSDPGTNARVTILGSGNGTRWGAWQTYVEGTYRNFL